MFCIYTKGNALFTCSKKLYHPRILRSSLPSLIDIKQRKAAAWRACSKLSKIWKSSLPRRFKLRLFAVTVESVLLYGCEGWTTTTKIEKELGGCYTRMLRTVLNVHWKQYMTNAELYDKLPRISQKIRERRTRFAGHCFRCEEPVSNMIFWAPKHGNKKPGRPALTYIDIFKKDTRWDSDSIKTVMQDRGVWKAIVDLGHDPP